MDLNIEKLLNLVLELNISAEDFDISDRNALLFTSYNVRYGVKVTMTFDTFEVSESGGKIFNTGRANFIKKLLIQHTHIKWLENKIQEISK